MEQDNIVKELLKVDFHIHSIYSSAKDEDKVSQNTIENIPVLIGKLVENEIDMIAITDHNTFNYQMYCELKKYENKELKKVFPGIEFDVEMKGKIIHVISIFDDRNNDAILKIEKVLEEIKFDGKNKKSFKERTFKNILTEINTNVIIIAHQKNDITEKQTDRNLSNIGIKNYNEIIKIDYFDAIEFRRCSVEGMLKTYHTKNNLENFRYITGTDCHNWNYYPQSKSNETEEISFSYLKCLPSFKGLIMALTEKNRVTTSTYNLSAPFIDKIDIEIENKKYNINLSPGINVIIGDNSIGKSMLLETLYDNKYTNLNTNVKTGYKKYLKDKKIKIESIPEEKKSKILYDSQGKIREKFQGDTSLLDVPYYKSIFKELDTKYYEDIIIGYVDKFVKLINNNEKIEECKNKLDLDIVFPSEIEKNNYYLSIIGIDNYELEKKDYNSLINQLVTIINDLNNLKNSNLLEKKDITIIIKEIEKMNKLKDKYSLKMIKENYKEQVLNMMKNICSDIEKTRKKQSEANDNKITTYKETLDLAITNINKYIKKYNEPQIDIFKDFKTININIQKEVVGKYEFITKTKENIIDEKLMKKILLNPFKRISFDEIKEYTTIKAKDKIKKTKIKNANEDFQQIYKSNVKKYINEDILAKELKILKNNQDISSGNSQGRNAIYYLDTIANDKITKLYISDQPDDDISHLNLNNEVIEIFRNMSENKQIIFITHKPELVVNLDVDNVIILKEIDSQIIIQNGALEFEDENTNILKDVAELLDGGEETIRKRWKRYDKQNY